MGNTVVLLWLLVVFLPFPLAARLLLLVLRRLLLHNCILHPYLLGFVSPPAPRFLSFLRMKKRCELLLLFR